jgi:molybdate transport system substrate-binding protein
MKRIRALVCLVAMALILVSASGGAVAAEIRVLSGGAVKAALTDLADAWGKETGHRAAIAYATTGASMQKIVAGEPVDVIILAAEAIEQLARKGAVAAGTVTDIARAGSASPRAKARPNRTSPRPRP